MAMLALKALSIGSEKIPDKAFHAVPGGYFRPEGEPHPFSKSKKGSRSGKKRKDKDEGMHDNGTSDSESHHDTDARSRRHHSSRRHKEKSEDYSASESGSDEDSSQTKKPQRPTRRNRRYQSSHDLDRGYDSDGLTHGQYQQSRGVPPTSPPSGQYFPPPPAGAFEDGPGAQPEPTAQYPSATNSVRDDSNRAPETANIAMPQQVSATYPFIRFFC